MPTTDSPSDNAGRGPVKRSVTIAGHRTSIALEPDFWDGLKEIAAARDLSLADLIRTIDEGRTADGPVQGLSSAIRVFVLNWYRT